MESRVPIVTILGHVDHGKTTILDYIRNAHVQAGEVGGITQKISAFTVDIKGKKITFVDTPGHEAFDLMRLRGGSIADIVLLIVAADDGVQPQTEESIEIIKNSKAKPIVVINKIDLPDVDIEKIKRDLSSKGLQVEGLGGKIPVVLVSGKTGKGIDTLLETITLVAEVEGLQKKEELQEGVLGKGFVLESIKDKSKGNISTMVITQGRLEKGLLIGYLSANGIQVERIKGVISEEGKPIEALNTGYGGKVLGLNEMIALGSEIVVLKEKNEKLVESILKKPEVEEVVPEVTPEGTPEAGLDLSALFADIKKEDDKKTLKVVIKSSSEGSLEAIKKSLEKINEDGYTVEIIKSGVGDILSADVEIAIASKAIVLGFEVKFEKGVQELASKHRVLVRSYDLIYKLIDEITDAIESLSLPQETEEEIGSGEVKALFTLSNGSQVIGCKVKKGVFKKGAKVYAVRGDDILFDGRIESLKHLKEDIVEAGVGIECGVILNTHGEVVIGDSLYCYKIIK